MRAREREDGRDNSSRDGENVSTDLHTDDLYNYALIIINL